MTRQAIKGGLTDGFLGEVEKVRYDVVPYVQGTGLDLGCGPWKIHHKAIGIDNEIDKSFELETAANLQMDCRDLRVFATGQFDYVFSSHLLEDYKDWQKVLKEWWRVVKVGGYLVLYLPHPVFYSKAQAGIENPHHSVPLYPNDIIGYMKSLHMAGWDLVVNEEREKDSEVWHKREYSFLQVWQKRGDGKQRESYLRPKPEKTCAVIRYGGAGDLLVATSILANLKAEGWHITFVTDGKGYEIIKEHPCVDVWQVDHDGVMVGDEDLIAYWDRQRVRFDRVISLYESFETALLSKKERGNHYWPYSVRRQLYGHWSYLDMTHVIAQVPMPASVHFYPTAQEETWAREAREHFGRDKFVVLLGLTGSGENKTYPHLARAIHYFLQEHPHAFVVTTGHKRAQILEQDYMHPRIARTSGNWSFREAMAFAQVADLVVGPETGLLWSVAMEAVPKVVLMSHSSVENLCTHWLETTPVLPEDTYCYPCHQLQHDRQTCNRYPDNPKSALCCGNISAEMIYNAMQQWVKDKEQAA